MRSLAISLLGVAMLVATIVVAVIASRMPTDEGFDPWFIGILMRDATDLPTVAHDLDLTVRRAIAPSSVGLWLREGGR